MKSLSLASTCLSGQVFGVALEAPLTRAPDPFDAIPPKLALAASWIGALRAVLATLVLMLLVSGCQSPKPPSFMSEKRAHAQTSEAVNRFHLEGRLFIEVTHSESEPVLDPRQTNHSTGYNKTLSPQRTQRINAPFELDLEENVFGELRLLGPLGTTSALITWSPEHAQLQSTELDPPLQWFPNLALLVHHWLKADLPLEHILRWLEGQDTKLEGWQFSSPTPSIKTVQGKGLEPWAPQVNLKLILNEPSP